MPIGVFFSQPSISSVSFFGLKKSSSGVGGGPPLPHQEDRPDVTLAAEGGPCGARAGRAGAFFRFTLSSRARAPAHTSGAPPLRS